MTEPPPKPKVAVVDRDSLSLGPFTSDSLNLVIDPERVAAIGRLTVQIRDGVAVAMADMGKRVGEQVKAFQESLRAAPPEPELDMSPRAVALRARQSRHTGPRGNPRQHRRR